MAWIQIGWLNLSEDKVFTDKGYECSAWFQDVAVKSGKYPMFIDGNAIWADGRVDGTARIHADLPGTVVSDYFGSMFCGVPVGSYDGTKNSGRESSYWWELYAFSFAEWVSTGKVNDGISIEIADGFKVNVGTRFSTVYEKEIPDYHIARA